VTPEELLAAAADIEKIDDIGAFTPSTVETLKEVLGQVWDRGWDSAASCYWHKPRNPYTGKMNDDAVLYCPEHGGSASPESCDHESHPTRTPPTCTCEEFTEPLIPEVEGVVAAGGWCAPTSTYFDVRNVIVGPHHAEDCPLYVVFTLPEVKVARGGIKYDTGDQR
jgi:hypothetical protein